MASWAWLPWRDRAPGSRRGYAWLRRELDPDPGRPRYLITEPGIGYCRYQP